MLFSHLKMFIVHLRMCAVDTLIGHTSKIDPERVAVVTIWLLLFESGYDWASGEYSSWTESTWDTFSVRLFLVPSEQFQVSMLQEGVVTDNMYFYL